MSVCILSLLGLFVPREDGKSGGGGEVIQNSGWLV